MSENNKRLETRVVHAGSPHPRIHGAAVTPIFQCAVYEHLAEGSAYGDVLYPRLGNLPNQLLLENRLASLESGERALISASGMAAISTALLTTVPPGGHLLIDAGLYGGTHSFVSGDFRRMGRSFDFIDGMQPKGWEALVRPETRAIYVESMTNPLLHVPDHAAVVEFARRHRLRALIDNTFATPVNFLPLEFGYDIALHSCTKYLNGHSDLVAGAAIGPAAALDAMRQLQQHLGAALDPNSCFLLERGMRTLVLRVERQNANALELARRLQQLPSVECVHYPGLESHPQHARAKELFLGFGGMLSFEPAGGAPAARRLLERLKLILPGPSLGGVESLATRPVTTSHAGLDDAELERLGIGQGLVRLSVGIEDPGDIAEDLEGALG